MTMEAPDTGVRVRMYDARVGDCFLLAFAGRDGPVHMLIDCGVHSQVRGGSGHVRSIVEHIRDSTNNHLHVVAVSHEHGDHISGFHYGHDIFENMAIDDVWFAWTEDDTNPLANRLDRARGLMLRGLQAAAPALRAAGDPAGHNVNSLLGFFGISPGLGVRSRPTRDRIKELASPTPTYLRPKCAPIRLPGVDGVRIFVLGPPEDERFLMRARPSKKPGEVYHADQDHALSLDEMLSMAYLAAAETELDSDEQSWAESAHPFAGNYRLPVHIVKAQRERYSFFHDRYGFDPNEPEPWRRLHSDWQMGAESLALKLDAATNNTSLVLAIELEATGKVLLFAADAQVGNWQSWHDTDWTADNGLDRGEEPISARDLLARTVLYKVGHHGSHNATLRSQGLELMTSPDLTAMIPVDEGWARARRPHPWKMPFGPLYQALLSRTRERIVRADVGIVEPEVRTPVWDEFNARVDVGADKFYVDVAVPDS